MISAHQPTTSQLEAILAIDTSTNVCSLALLSREGVIAERIDRKGNEHAALIARFADELKSEASEKGYSIVAVAVSGGPGSYTGLRIGASFAKGYCFASGKPLIAVSTLESLAWGAIEQRLIPQGALIVPMIDAGRMEVYTATYSAEGIQLVAPQAEIIQPESYTDVPLDTPICLIGNGAAKCADRLPLPDHAHRGVGLLFETTRMAGSKPRENRRRRLLGTRLHQALQCHYSQK